VNKVH